MDDTGAAETAFDSLASMLSKGTLRLVDLNGRELNIPAQSIDGQVVSQDMSLIVCLAVLCSIAVAIAIGLVLYKICCRLNVVAPLKIHSPKSYLYPNLFLLSCRF